MPPDGFEVALAQRGADGKLSKVLFAQFSVEGGALKAKTDTGGIGTFDVVPEPGAREVKLIATLKGQRAEATYAVGPPAARVELSLNPPTPVKGRDKDAELLVRLLKTDGTPDKDSSPPVLQANVGTLEAVTLVEPGVYRAKYALPDTGYPEVAVIVAFSPWPSPSSVYGSFGALRVPLATSFALPGVTEPNAKMTIDIAGQKFGPTQAGPDGKFQLDVVVPPGFRFAKGLAVDRAGNRRTTTIDMAVPPTDQLACVMNPRTLPADGSSRARILCAVSDPFGKPIKNAKVSLTVKRGSLVGPKAVGDLLEWLYTAPKPPSLEKDTLKASAKQAGPASMEDFSVELVQGPAANANVVTGEPLVHRGGQTAVTAEVRDAFGRPRAGALVQLRVTPGTTTKPEEFAPGWFRANWDVPEEAKEQSGTVELRAFGPTGTAPAAIRAWAEGNQLIVGVADVSGAPVPNQSLLVGEQKVQTGEDGTAAIALPPLGSFVDVAHAEWPGLKERIWRVREAVVFPKSSSLGTAASRVQVKLGPPLPVNVRVSVKGREVTYWVEDPKGTLLPKRPVEVKLSGGARSAEEERDGRRKFTVSADAPVSVSIADSQTGVTALAVVRP